MAAWWIPPLRGKEGHIHSSCGLQGLPVMKPSMQTQAGAPSGAGWTCLGGCRVLRQEVRAARVSVMEGVPFRGGDIRPLAGQLSYHSRDWPLRCHA